MKFLKKNIVFVILSALSLSFLFSGIDAYARAVTSVSGSLETGAVRLELSAKKKQADPILPGQKISYVPAITNKGYECFLRAKYDFGVYSQYAEAVDFPSDWIRADDGYWYFTGSVKPEKSIVFFNGIQISSDLPKETSGTTMTVCVTAEAVQKKNFEPDFTSSRPWGGLKAEVFSKSEKYKVIEDAPEAMPLTITYESEADRLIANSEQFLLDLPILLPGETYTSGMILKNTHDEPLTLMFYSETDQDDRLLNSIDLTIDSSDRGTIYDGKLSAKDLNGSDKAVIISRADSQKEEKITFTLHVPEELKNSYTLWKSPVKWTFTTEVSRKPSAVPTPAPAPSAPSSAPKTADTSGSGFYRILLGGASFALTLGIFLMRTRKRG